MNFDLSTSTSPWYQAPITPSNTVDFDTPTQGIYVGVGGDVSVVRHDGTAVLFVGVPAGSVLPVVARRVGVSGTSASGLVGLWGVELGPAWSTAPVPEFSPLDLSPVLWLDASDTSTITESGGAVSQWDDKSGNGNNVVQGTAAYQPTTGTRTLNGLNALDFAGDKLAVSWATLGVPSHYFLVVQADVLAADRRIIDGTSSNRRIVGVTALDEWQMSAGTVLSGGTADTSAHLLHAVFNTTSSVFYVDSVSTLTGDAGANSSAGITIGSSYVFTQNAWDGAIAEIIVVDGTLTAGEIADTESYLANKWGITL